MKKISLLLSLMLLISAFSFTNVMAAGNDYLCYDDFSTGTIDQKWSSATEANGFSVADEYLQVAKATSAKVFRSDMVKAITTGVVKLELDYKFQKGPHQYIGMNKSNGGSAAQLWLLGGDGNVRYGEDVLDGTKTKTNSGKYLTAGKWYHIEIEYDLDFNKMAFRITEKDTGAEFLKETDIPFTSNVVSPFFRFDTAYDFTTPIGIDNVKVYPIDEISLDDAVLNKSFTDLNDDFSDGIDSKWTNATEANGFSVAEERLQVAKATSAKVFRSDMTTAISTGVVKLELDYKPEVGAIQYIGMNKSNGASAAQLAFLETDKSIRYGENVFGTMTNSGKKFTAGNWYHIEIEYDLDFNKMAIQITNDGDNILKVTDIQFTSNVASPFFMFNASGTLTTPIGIDNVSFSAVNPTVNATLSNGTDTYTDLAKVPVDANTLTIDFGTAMHTQSVDYRRVALKKADGTFVSATGAWAEYNRKYVLTLNEDLTPGAEYTLFVSEKVVNVNCVGLGENSETVIKIDPGKLTVAISDVKSGENSVANTLANFTGTVTPELTVTNTTGKEHTANVIYAYYTENGLKAAPVDNDVTIAADGTVKGLDAHPVLDLSDVEAVKIMVWSDMTNIEPLCTVYEIK